MVPHYIKIVEQFVEQLKVNVSTIKIILSC